MGNVGLMYSFTARKKSPFALYLALVLLAVGRTATGQENQTSDKGLDVEVAAEDLTPVSTATADSTSGDLMIKRTGAGFSWEGRIAKPGTYQVWVTYYCGDHKARARLTMNGQEKQKPLMYMGADKIKRFYDKNGKSIRMSKDSPIKVEKYYFREYWGAYKLSKDASIRLTFSDATDVAVHKLELMRERDFDKSLEPLLFAAIDFYQHLQIPGRLVRAGYRIDRSTPFGFSSIANCGVALMAYAMNHELGRDPDAARKALALLRACNGKVLGLKPDRHRTGFFMHFINPNTGAGRSEHSTIDTSILVSGALLARNAFDDPQVKAEADELWNSVDWSAAVVSTDPSMPRFYLKGSQIDGKEKGTITMFNEYILLAWFCQMYENQKKGADARSHIMPDLDKLPCAVYKNRILLSNGRGGLHPSFLVQFPFYMSNLCSDELFFSYTAAQAVADRTTGIERHGDRSAWGVGPGCTPERGYLVDSFNHNKENVMSPRLVAGFIAVYPPAATDLLLRHKVPGNRLKLEFGTILPRFVPGKDWKPYRLAGIDFSCLLLGMAGHHPGLGINFFQRSTKFTFNR